MLVVEVLCAVLGLVSLRRSRRPSPTRSLLSNYTARLDIDEFVKYSDAQLAEIIARCDRRLEEFAIGDRWEVHRRNAAARKRRAETELSRRAST